MNLLIIENNFLLKENLFFQKDLKNSLNLIFKSTIKETKEALDKENFDFILISSLLPDFNSFDVINKIFEKKPKKKIIQILDKKGDFKHKFSSFSLKKPFMINKLLLIINKPKKKNFLFSKNFNLKSGLVFIINKRKLQNKIQKKEIRLTEKECDILIHLIKQKKFVKKKDLLNNIWGFNEKVKTRTLETHIYRLRKKIIKKFGIKRFIIVQNNSYKLF